MRENIRKIHEDVGKMNIAARLRWQEVYDARDFDVFDGDRDVGRIHLVDSYGDRERWFWGVSFQLTRRKSYGHAPSFDEAKAAFRAEYAGFVIRPAMG